MYIHLFTEYIYVYMKKKLGLFIMYLTKDMESMAPCRWFDLELLIFLVRDLTQGQYWFDDKLIVKSIRNPAFVPFPVA